MGVGGREEEMKRGERRGEFACRRVFMRTFEEDAVKSSPPVAVRAGARAHRAVPERARACLL
jgi:hypothetical protein